MALFWQRYVHGNGRFSTLLIAEVYLAVCVWPHVVALASRVLRVAKWLRRA